MLVIKKRILACPGLKYLVSEQIRYNQIKLVKERTYLFLFLHTLLHFLIYVGFILSQHATKIDFNVFFSLIHLCNSLLCLFLADVT